MIYFKIKESEARLEGVIYIDDKNYAVSKRLLYAHKVDISGVHEFTYILRRSHHDQTFKIVKGKNDDDIKILGG
jgi:hypothetical protein